MKRSNFIVSVLIVIFCLSSFGQVLAGEKLFTKSKEPKFFDASEENTLMYFIHKDYDKTTQYITVDKTPMAILPKNSYCSFTLSPGWHLLTIAQKNETKIENFEIYCYPGEIQILNLISMRKAKVQDDIEEASEKGKIGSDAYNSEMSIRHIIRADTNKDFLFYFDRYPENTLKESVSKDKLQFVEITDAGRSEIMEHLDRSVEKRNKNIFKKNNPLKLTFEEAVEDYQLPDRVPEWDEQWEYDLVVTPASVNAFKLGLTKKSHVIIDKTGIEIQDEKNPEKNAKIPFENVTGFERKRQMGAITPPYFLIVNYTDGGEAKQLQFFTKEYDPFSIDDNWEAWQNENELLKKYFPTDEETLKKQSLTVHPVQSVGYYNLIILNDIAFWREREFQK